jgi:hypothetical protein
MQYLKIGDSTLRSNFKQVPFFIAIQMLSQKLQKLNKLSAG